MCAYPFPIYTVSRSRHPEVPMPNFVDRMDTFCVARWACVTAAEAARLKYEQTNNAKYLQYAQFFERVACEDRAKEYRYTDGSWKMEYHGGAKLLLNSRNNSHASWPVVKSMLRTQFLRYHSGLAPLWTNDELPLLLCTKPANGGLITCAPAQPGDA